MSLLRFEVDPIEDGFLGIRHRKKNGYHPDIPHWIVDDRYCKKDDLRNDSLPGIHCWKDGHFRIADDRNFPRHGERILLRKKSYSPGIHHWIDLLRTRHRHRNFGDFRVGDVLPDLRYFPD